MKSSLKKTTSEVILFTSCMTSFLDETSPYLKSNSTQGRNRKRVKTNKEKGVGLPNLSVSHSQSSFDDVHLTPRKKSPKEHKEDLKSMPMSKSMASGLRIQGKESYYC